MNGEPPHVVVIGGGIAGLAAAERLSRGEPGRSAPRVTLIEQQHRLGGVIGTERTDGFVLEEGPDVFLASKPAALDLSRMVGVEDRVIATSSSVGGAYVLGRRGLQRLPAGMSGLVPSRLMPFLGSRVISPLGKLRALSDLVIPPRRERADESVEQFVVRRVGRETYERLVEPLLTGIYAGDGARLSLAATFPQLAELERVYGGIIRGLRRRSRVVRHDAPTGFRSFAGGMAELVEGVERVLRSPERALHTDIRLGSTASTIELTHDEEGPGGATVIVSDGEVLRADAVVLATPAEVTAALLARADPAIAGVLREIEHVSTATITVGFHAADVGRPLDATGYTVPRVAGRAVIACTWSSAKLPHRAPPGHALVRLYVGGAGREEHVQRSDAELLALARAELREVMGITAAPQLVRIRRWERSMPQYNLGHLDRIGAIGERMSHLPGIALAGNAYAGVGIPDCIRSGQSAAERVLERLANASVRPAGIH